MRRLPHWRTDTTQSQSILNPAGPAAQHISDLWFIILVPALLVLLLVGGAIIYAAFRFREREADAPEPKQIGGNNALEFTWTLVPALILLSIFFLTIAQLNFIRAVPAEAQSAMTIKVIGRQWSWSFQYPSAPGSKKIIPELQHPVSSRPARW